MDITRLKRSCEHDATYSNGGYNVPELRTKLPLNRDIAQKCRSCLEAIKHYKTRLIGAKISKKFTEVDVWHDLLVKCDTCHDALFKQLQKDADLGYMDRPMSDDRGHRTQNTLLQY